MINFASVKELTIPEGKVTRINRAADGVLLWKADTGYGHTALEFDYIPRTTSTTADDGTVTTTYDSGKVWLKFYKNDAASTRIYLNKQLIATTTTSDFNSIELFAFDADNYDEVSTTKYVLEIVSEGSYYFGGHRAENSDYVDVACISDIDKFYTQTGASDNTNATFSYIELDEMVTWIYDASFYSVQAGSKVIMANTITVIRPMAFGSSVNVYWRGSLAEWLNVNIVYSNGSAFAGGYYLYINNTMITELVIPSSFTTIADYKFYNLKGVRTVSVPNSVSSFGNYSFSGCSLSSIDIPTSVTSIGAYCFGSCSSLFEITIPSSVITIGDYAFSNSTSCYIDVITFVHTVNDSLTLGTNVFRGKNAYNLTVNHYGNSAVLNYDYAGNNATVTFNQLG